MSGKYLFRTHAGEAIRLLKEGAALPDDDEINKISRIVIIRAPTGTPKPSRDLSPGSYGTRYSFVENIGNTVRVHQLKTISNKDAWAFRLSRTDTLVDSFPADKLYTDLLKKKGKL